MEDYLDPLVQWGAELGLYIFIGWHAHGNPITGFNPDPRLDNPDPEVAKSALRDIAERYRDKPWVLYGTFNEPTRIAWADWRPVAEELVDAVHATYPEAFVFVSGGKWGFDPASDNPNLRGTAQNYGLPLVQYAEARGIGWTGWVWHTIWEPAILMSWEGYAPTEFGHVVKNSLQSTSTPK